MVKNLIVIDLICRLSYFSKKLKKLVFFIRILTKDRLFWLCYYYTNIFEILYYSLRFLFFVSLLKRICTKFRAEFCAEFCAQSCNLRFLDPVVTMTSYSGVFKLADHEYRVEKYPRYNQCSPPGSTRVCSESLLKCIENNIPGIFDRADLEYRIEKCLKCTQCTTPWLLTSSTKNYQQFTLEHDKNGVPRFLTSLITNVVSKNVQAVPSAHHPG